MNLRRAFGQIADSHSLGTASKYVDQNPYPDNLDKWKGPGVYKFKAGGRRFDGRERKISDATKAIRINQLFRYCDKHLKKPDKRYHKTYEHGRFDDAEMEVTVCPNGKVEMSVFSVIEKLIELLSDDHGEEEVVKDELAELYKLLQRL